MSLVVDASIAIKWVLQEELTEQADALLAQSLHTGSRLTAPSHLPGEVANGLYRRSLRTDNNAISPDAAEEALTTFVSIPIRLLTPQDLPLEAWRFARRHQLPSIYDALYVVLARRLNAEFWTADQRLMTSLRGNAPWVRWLGDFPV